MQEPQEAQYEDIIDDFSQEGRGSLVETLPTEPDFESFLTGELRDIMIGINEYNQFIKDSKTNAKKNLYKKKIDKLRKRAKMILYSQYLNGKKFPVESSQNSVE